MRDQNQHYTLKTCWFCLGLVLATGVFATSDTQESDLFGMLEQDLLAQNTVEEPNVIEGQHQSAAAGVSSPIVAAAAISGVAVSAAVISPTADQNDVQPAMMPFTATHKDLWRARVSSTAALNDSQIKSELAQIIQQVSTIEIKPSQKPKETEPEVQPAAANEPNAPIAEAPLNGQKEEPKKPDGAISAETLNYFVELSKNPAQLQNPLELAGILYNGGCFDEAAICYKEVLSRQPAAIDDKSWIMLQLGNCLRLKDPAAARESYDALVAEFPNSPWAPLAKAKSDLIGWYLADQPKTLITKQQ